MRRPARSDGDRDFFDSIRRLAEESREREEEENNKRIGDFKVKELKALVRLTIREEATTGDLPLLNRTREKQLKKWTWIVALVFVFGAFGYWMLFYESDYRVEFDGNSLILAKSKGWSVSRRQIEVIDGKWQLRYQLGEHAVYAPVYTPFETEYNRYYKLIFLEDGKLLWVANDRTSVRPVKLINGSWHFKSDVTGEWVGFDSLYDKYEDPVPADPQ